MILPFWQTFGEDPCRGCHLTWPLVRPWTSNSINNDKNNLRQRLSTFHSTFFFPEKLKWTTEEVRNCWELLCMYALYWSVLLTLSSSWSTHKPSPFQRRIVKIESIGIFLRKLRAKRTIWRQNRVSSIGLSKFSVRYASRLSSLLRLGLARLCLEGEPVCVTRCWCHRCLVFCAVCAPKKLNYSWLVHPIRFTNRFTPFVPLVPLFKGAVTRRSQVATPGARPARSDVKADKVKRIRNEKNNILESY